MFVTLSKYIVNLHLHKPCSHEVIISGGKNHIPPAWNLCNDSSPHVLLPDFGSNFIYLHYFHCPLMTFRSICPYHRECSKKYNGSAAEKKVPIKLLKQKKRLKNLWLKCWNPLALIYIPDYLNCTTLFLFLFCFVLFCSFCESQNNCVKNMLISISLYYFCSFFIWIFFSRIELNFVNLCSLGCTWEFSSYFGLRVGDEEESLDPNGNLWGFPHTTSCQSHALY